MSIYDGLVFLDCGKFPILDLNKENIKNIAYLVNKYKTWG